MSLKTKLAAAAAEAAAAASSIKINCLSLIHHIEHSTEQLPFNKVHQRPEAAAAADEDVDKRACDNLETVWRVTCDV